MTLYRISKHPSRPPFNFMRTFRWIGRESRCVIRCNMQWVFWLQALRSSLQKTGDKPTFNWTSMLNQTKSVYNTNYVIAHAKLPPSQSFCAKLASKNCHFGGFGNPDTMYTTSIITKGQTWPASWGRVVRMSIFCVVICLWPLQMGPVSITSWYTKFNSSMEAILACHPALQLSRDWLNWVANSCELWCNPTGHDNL